MFHNDGAFSGFAVDDLDAAKTFYADTLGLKVDTLENGFLMLRLGSGGSVLVYGKEQHDPAGFTILNFPVDDVAAAVDDLTARGIEMLRYDGVDHDERGIVHGMGPDIAWFTDPAGNVLAVLAD
jgi:catechol 2,3-dioxygenase-like lactoylglutathione lyase family enzyme